MSYSFREPEWPDVCECKYNEARDEMDREDCPFHCPLIEAPQAATERAAKRKGPAITGDVTESAA